MFKHLAHLIFNPAEPPSIMINKNKENFTHELNLFPIRGKNTELSFSGDRISSDGGLLLLREPDYQLNLMS